MTQSITPNEKLLAAFGYWGSLLLWLFPALVLWVLKKNESAFIAKHTRNAMALNVVFALLMVVLNIVGHVLSWITFGLGGLLILLVQAIVILIVMVYILYLGVQVFQGEDPDVAYLSDYLNKHLSS